MGVGTFEVREGTIFIFIVVKGGQVELTGNVHGWMIFTQRMAEPNLTFAIEFVPSTSFAETQMLSPVFSV